MSPSNCRRRISAVSYGIAATSKCTTPLASQMFASFASCTDSNATYDDSRMTSKKLLRWVEAANGWKSPATVSKQFRPRRQKSRAGSSLNLQCVPHPSFDTVACSELHSVSHSIGEIKLTNVFCSVFCVRLADLSSHFIYSPHEATRRRGTLIS